MAENWEKFKTVKNKEFNGQNFKFQEDKSLKLNDLKVLNFNG